MRSSKFVTLIAMTMAITAVMFFLKSGMIERAAQIDKICKAAVNDPTINYTTYFKNFTSAYENYTGQISNYSSQVVNILTPADSNDSQLLIDYVKSQDIDKAIEYARKRAGPYLIFIAFAVISLISWLVYCGCCCKPCCCCRKSESDSCCKFVSLLLSLIGFTGVIIGCIIGFSYSSKFVDSTNGTTCSFLLFYNDVVNGETTQRMPKWIGINPIKKTLADTSLALDKIALAFPSAFSDNSWSNGATANFEKKLGESYKTYSGQTLNNLNPANSLKGGVVKITPLYMTQYGDYTTSGTALNIIYQEYNTVIKGSLTLMDQAKQYSTNVNTYMADIKSTLNNIQNNVNTMTSAFDSISTEVIDILVDAQNKANDNGVTAFLVLFAILIGLATLCIVFLVLMVFCNCKFFRFFLHIFWNIITLLMILTFLLGGVFGILGLVGKDGVPVMKWIFGKENLLSAAPKIVTSTTTAGYINTCVNGNGDLSKTFIPDGSTSNNLDQLYQVSYTLSTTKTTIKANNKSKAVAQVNTQYTNMINDISLTTSAAQGSNDINAILTEMRAWTDSSIAKYQKGCSPAANDVWVQSQAKCLSDYPYTANGGTLGNKNCMLFPEFSGNSATSRYASLTGCAAGSTDFSNVGQAVGAYAAALNQYVADNRALINQLIANNNNLDLSFIEMSNNLLVSLDKISGVIDPLVTLFQNIVGKNGLFQLINCGFMQSNLNYFYSTLTDSLAPNSLNLAAIIIAVSFLEAIAIFFLLIVLLKNSGAAAEESKSESNAVLKSA